jgi:membrane carboxypeptidase/penicillin-binding protein PbpC
LIDRVASFTSDAPEKKRGGAARPQAFEIVNPPSGATYLIDPTLRREFQTLALRVVVERPGRIEWQIDGAHIGSASSDSPLMWPLVPGKHRITAHDARGRVAETMITVK